MQCNAMYPYIELMYVVRTGKEGREEGRKEGRKEKKEGKKERKKGRKIPYPRNSLSLSLCLSLHWPKVGTYLPTYVYGQGGMKPCTRPNTYFN